MEIVALTVGLLLIAVGLAGPPRLGAMAARQRRMWDRYLGGMQRWD
jgi:hypothetical protein